MGIQTGLKYIWAACQYCKHWPIDKFAHWNIGSSHAHSVPNTTTECHTQFAMLLCHTHTQPFVIQNEVHSRTQMRHHPYVVLCAQRIERNKNTGKAINGPLVVYVVFSRNKIWPYKGWATLFFRLAFYSS